MSTEQGWYPSWGVPPGEHVCEVLAQRGMTQTALARAMGRPVKTINEIVNGKAAITPETALGLERVLGISAVLWVRLEAEYRLSLARQRQGEEAES